MAGKVRVLSDRLELIMKVLVMVVAGMMGGAIGFWQYLGSVQVRVHENVQAQKMDRLTELAAVSSELTGMIHDLTLIVQTHQNQLETDRERADEVRAYVLKHVTDDHE